MSAPIPEYEKYTLLDLYQVLNSIRQDLVPHVYEALVQEIDSRAPTSVEELEDCFFALDKEKNPEFAAKLEGQIAALSGSINVQREPITADEVELTETDREVVRKRPKLVWAICMLYAFGIVWGVFSVYAVLSGLAPLGEAQKAYFESISIAYYIFGATGYLVHIAAVVLLFRLRKLSYYLFLGLFVTGVLSVVWTALTRDWVAVFGASVIVGAAIGWTVQVLILVYLRKLIQRGTLQ